MKNQPINAFALEHLENRRLLSGETSVAADLLTTQADVLAATATITPTTPHVGISKHMKHVLHLKHVDHVKHTFFVKRQARALAREVASDARVAFAMSMVPTAELKADGASPEAEAQGGDAE